MPDDAAVILMPGPRTDLFRRGDALNGYLGRGGKLLVMVNPPFPQKVQDEALKRLLGKYGVELGDNLVVELSPIGRLFGIGPEIPIVQQYEPHTITRDLAGLTTLFPLTRTVTPAKTVPPGTSVQPLARTSQRAGGRRTALHPWGQFSDGPDPRGRCRSWWRSPATRHTDRVRHLPTSPPTSS